MPWRGLKRGGGLGQTGDAVEQGPASKTDQQRPKQKTKTTSPAAATRRDQADLQQQGLNANAPEAPQQHPGEQKTNGLQVARHGVVLRPPFCKAIQRVAAWRDTAWIECTPQ